MDYSDRRLTGVEIVGLKYAPSDAGHAVYGDVALTFSNFAGEDAGPQIYFNLAVPVAETHPEISTAERLLLAGIAALLDRAARESGASLFDCVRRGRRSETSPKEENAQ
jgi:hypothetical protein